MSDGPAAMERRKRLRETIEYVKASAEQGDIAPAAGFLANSRVEVLWNLSRTVSAETEESAEEDENEEMESIWWPATVLCKTDRLHILAKDEDAVEVEGPQSIPIYEIKYDARPPEFPTAEIATVCVTGEHVLIDVGSSEETESLIWRREGETWTPSDSEFDHDENVVPASLQSLLETFDVEETAAAQLHTRGNLEISQQMANELVEGLLGGLAKKYSNDLETLPRDRVNAVVDKLLDVKIKLARKIQSCLFETGRFTEEDAQRIVLELGPR